jgi:hypothetical protein
VCLLRSQAAKKYIYTANCGDARAVLCKNGRALRLSKVRRAPDAWPRDGGVQRMQRGDA